MKKAQQIIKQLGLQPHPSEGGFYVETYRSEDLIPVSALPKRYEGTRTYATAIYYLLTPGTFSEMHRLASDEVFHFYLGDPVLMLQLYPDGSSQKYVLGKNLKKGQHLQLTVPLGVWQGARLEKGGEFALLGCTVAPGFEFADYERGEREGLIKRYPHEADLIRKLTKK